MGNRCVTPCGPSPPNVKSRVRCLYFCCLKGTNIRVIHLPPEDEIDGGGDTISVIIDNTVTKRTHGEKREYCDKK